MSGGTPALAKKRHPGPTPPTGLLKTVSALEQLANQNVGLSRGFGDREHLAGLLSGVSSDVVARWRSELLLGEEARALVAGNMSRLIADASLARALKEAIAPMTGENVARMIRQVAQQYVSGIGQAVREAITESIKPAAWLATTSMFERLKAANERQRKYEDALWQLGWWLPPSATMDFFWEVGELAFLGKRTALRRAMVELARERAFGRVVEGWMELEPFRRRRRFIRAGLADHRRGRYLVSIPTLLPHIEGIAIDAFLPGSPDRSPKRAIKTAVASYEMVMGPAMVETVTILWRHEDFDKVKASSRRLNRQLILHGRSTGYPSEENSAKVLFALDLLASLVEDARKHPEWAKAS